MRVHVPFGSKQVDLEFAEERIVRARESPPEDLPDPVVALAAALEEPFRFPALRRALTPDDRITIVVDETLPHVGRLLGPILDHITGAGIEPQAIALLCPAGPSEHPWRQDLPAVFRRATIHVHDPANTKGLCYLATSKEGQRLYLNRTLVEADQVVVLSGRRYDPYFGFAGAESALYPAFGDAETLGQPLKVRPLPPAEEPPAVIRAAREVAWLLGAPFFVQVIEGTGESVAAIVAGTHEAALEGRRRQDLHWRRTIPSPVGLVIATLPGDPARQTFADLATAVSRAARVVGTNGAVALVLDTAPETGVSGDFLRRCDDAEEALRKLGRQPSPELLSAWQWAGAATQARIYLHSPYPEETVEQLFATPLDSLTQVQRLADRAASTLLLTDAHKALPLLEV